MGLGLRGVALQIGLRKVVAVDFAPVAVVHGQRVALVLHLSGRDQLVGGIVNKVLREDLAVQPRAAARHLRHVAYSCPFDNMFSEISHFNRWSKFVRALYPN